MGTQEMFKLCEGCGRLMYAGQRTAAACGCSKALPPVANLSKPLLTTCNDPVRSWAVTIAVHWACDMSQFRSARMVFFEILAGRAAVADVRHAVIVRC